MSQVEEIKVPNCYDNRNPVGCDIAILKLYEGFKLDGCKIRPIILPSSPITLFGKVITGPYWNAYPMP